MATSNSVTMTLQDGGKIVITGGNIEVFPATLAPTITAPAAPVFEAPLTVADNGANGNQMTGRSPLWRTFNDPDIGAAAREALAAAVGEGAGNGVYFLNDVEKFVDRCNNTAMLSRHNHSVYDGLQAANAGNDWYDDTEDAELVAAASTLVLASRTNGPIVPPVLLAVATDILKAHQRGYFIATLVGYRIFAFRKDPKA